MRPAGSLAVFPAFGGIPNHDLRIPPEMKLTRPTGVFALALACLATQASAQQSAEVYDPNDKTPANTPPAGALVQKSVPVNPAVGLIMSARPNSGPSPDSPAVLYNNGPVANSIGTGPAGSDESILQTAMGHSVFGFGWTNGALCLTDDFTITDPFGWQIDELDVYGYLTGAPTSPSPHTDLRVAIYSGTPGTGTLVFGDLTTNRLTGSIWSNTYRRTDTSPGTTNRAIFRSTLSVGVNLPPGHYWIVYSANTGFAPPIEPLGVPSTGNAQQAPAPGGVPGAFVPLLNGLVDTCDMPFELRGSIRPPPCTNVYIHDDGTAENSVGLTAGGDLVWMNIFDACGGTDKLECVSVVFGSPGAGSGAILGSTFNIVVWDDPNDDGNPADGVLIAGPVKATVTSVDADVFVAATIPTTNVTGKFIVGVYMTHPAGIFPAAIDQGQSSNGRSWVTGSLTPGSYNPNTVGGPIGLFDVDQIGLPGVWLLRANDNCPPPPPPCLKQSIASLFASNNQGNIGGMVYFNLFVANPNGVVVESIDVNAFLGGVAGSLDVFTTPGGFNGKETNSALWTLVSSGAGVTAPNNTPSNFDVTDFALAPGLWGVAYRANGFQNAYTNGTATNRNYFSADCDISAGKASNVAFTAPLFNPRVVNTRINYCADAGTGTNYCRATLTNRGCLPHTTSKGIASASGAGGPFTVACEDLPSKKNGFLLFSLTGAQVAPFGAGTLCLQPQIFRLGIQNSGGGGICDGTFSDDFGAVIAANPGAFPIGEEVYCQYLFRESSLPGGSGLSDGHRFAIAP
jgi:hypothetical protein